LKDKNGLPYLPGKSIKGLLREAFTTAQTNHWFESEESDLIKLLFGNEMRDGEEAQGLIQVSSAFLSTEEIAYFNHQPEAKSHLYRVVSSTAIDHEKCVAKETSLRSMEVTVPVTLVAQISLNTTYLSKLPSDAKYLAQFTTWLSQVITLITELGAKRHRGFGKVIVSVQTSIGEPL